jgi:carboxyl-terminal processing protease
MLRRTSLLAGLVIGLFLSTIFLAGFAVGALVERNQSPDVATSDSNLRDFMTAYHLVTQRSYFRPFDKKHLIYAAIDGMLAATGDPHTLFLTPPENQIATSEINGSGFGGIGAIVASSRQGLQIVSPLPNAPAAKAGLRAGDVVTAIDGKSVLNMTGDSAIARIHGRSGTPVHLTVRRNDGHPFTVTVKRAAIPAITAYGRMLEHRIGYLQIISFGSDTIGQVTQALKSIDAQHPRGIIVDLRDNPGGYVDTAQSIVSEFVSHGIVAYEQDAQKHLHPLYVEKGMLLVHVPVVVLVNGGTASAAEITAGALRDDLGSKIIGTTTYGKGSMQSVYALADGSSIRITDRLWLTPDHHSIQKVGLKPDLQVTISGQQAASGLDPQLTTAERYLVSHVHS